MTKKKQEEKKFKKVVEGVPLVIILSIMFIGCLILIMSITNLGRSICVLDPFNSGCHYHPSDLISDVFSIGISVAFILLGSTLFLDRKIYYVEVK